MDIEQQIDVEILSDKRFEPARYSLQDLRFLLEHLGTPPAVALRKPMEPGTHPQSIKRLLTDVYNLEQVRAAEDDFVWAGIEKLTDSIGRYLAWHDRSLELQRRRFKDANGSLITHPSMYGWDEDGRAYKGAVDADAYDMVRTEILDDGSRKAFGLNILEPDGEIIPDLSSVAPWVKSGPRARIDDKVERTVSPDRKLGSLTCSICGFSQQFDAKDIGKERAASARMRKHMKDAKVSMNRHRMLLNKLAR